MLNELKKKVVPATEPQQIQQENDWCLGADEQIESLSEYLDPNANTNSVQPKNSTIESFPWLCRLRNGIGNL